MSLLSFSSSSFSPRSSKGKGGDDFPPSYKSARNTEGQLKPKVVDLSRNVNRHAHHTSAYEIPNLVLRRGQAFEMVITFERAFNRDDDSIVLKFVTGSRPLQSKGSVVSVRQVSEAHAGDWNYELVSVVDRAVTLKVISTPKAIVGRYEMFIDTFHKGGEGEVEKHRYKHPDDIYIIFNPWNEADDVYLDNPTEREEHVLRETGRIWLGTVGKFCVRPWNFGQFDDVCLFASLALLEKSELGDQARNNPVQVVRALCRVINNTERDSGVLCGNWSGKYDDGIPPHAWNGSSAILEEFLKKRKGVKYGQCWTFAAVATTLLRALGIPTRCVTCFRSSHDSDFSNPVNAHWSTDNRPRKSMDDAIWDYHVWGESWFRRPDLPPGYDGWQAFDPTPQECNEGVFTCGPASVKAIRKGELYYGFHAKFLFSEAHGERVHWLVDSDGNMTPFRVEKRVVGRQISTKAAGTISRLDITDLYKAADGSPEEAEILKQASRLCFRSVPQLLVNGCEDVEFTFQGDAQKAGDVHICLKMKNDSGHGRTIDVYLGCVSAYNTGVPATDLKETSTTVLIEPHTENDVQMSLKCADYINNKDTDSHVNVYVIATVRETHQRFATRDTIWIEKPHLEVKTEGRTSVTQPFQIVLKIVNTLSVPLTNGVFNVEGPGIQRLMGVKCKKTIGPGEECRETVTLKARRGGRHEIVANFYCRQICDVAGAAELDISDDGKN
ncbi:protein-glutamine gamma-glutamyltransferase K-like isoform X2 [Pomacea canaliculata]|uniref:protein-glutamine gamma-glutamyltransferase K-like isoform X2 n=1 Tax=Pomacea canaliculata TaxID=400727 RepID=UPI000D73E7F0|nr:protein-glutamine gamma-glutamyltransferase K-like isoform X2 [Pomacea canaliculata]